MRNEEYTFWQDGEFFVGHWNEYPDYQTQGYSEEELLEMLEDLLSDIKCGEISYLKNRKTNGSLDAQTLVN